jgi:ATP-dependent Lhr-like helicase
MAAGAPPDRAGEAESSAFYRLDERIQRWIWAEGWEELRDIQERAIPLVLAAERDIILAAATASGKTEAAFFPILTRLIQNPTGEGLVIYVSPLKALINDQWARLSRLCEALEIAVHPWHGDVSAAKKQKFFKRPAGVVLITPESLESLFVNHGHGLSALVGRLEYAVVDELHAFIGTERGKQLQSLLHRLEVLTKRRVPRVALSATLGDMRLAADFLRPGAAAEVALVISNEASQELKLIVKGYVNTAPRLSEKDAAPAEREGRQVNLEDLVHGGELAVAQDLFKALRGKNHLIFPNSRGKVELYADLLRRHCERLGVPNEFWPHHGSLSKDIREETEAALKRGERPATAICTTTLELGIDIGAVAGVAQIGPPPSVASLRQRLGRSGRRGDAAILRSYCIEEALDADSDLSDQLREGLVQTVALIRLLLEKWYEPPRIGGLHLSTLIQQLLSLIAQYGGVSAQKAWELLCGHGPFGRVSKSAFAMLLRELGNRDVLMQTDDGLLLHGGLGEKLVNHYTFYAAFTTEEEYRIVTQGRALGSVPVSHPLEEGSYVIFAGRRWRVVSVDSQHKVITVAPSPAGRPPLFGGGGGLVHDHVREEMRRVYEEADPPVFLDQTAREFLSEARKAFDRYDLETQRVVQVGSAVYLFPWRGDIVHNTLALLLKHRNCEALNEGLSVVVYSTERERLVDVLGEISEDESLTDEALSASIKTKTREKWDWLLTEQLLCADYAASSLDVGAARAACRALVE